MSGQSKMWSFSDKFKGWWSDFKSWLKKTEEWCGGEFAIHTKTINIDIHYRVICYTVLGFVLLLLLLLIPDVLEAGALLGTAGSWVLSLVRMLVNFIKSPLELMFTLVRGGIGSFQEMFLGVGGGMFATGGTLAGLLGLNPYLMRIFVFNLIVFVVLKMWHYALVDHDTWIKTPTYRIFHFLNTPLADFKYYLKEFLPSFLYPIVGSLLFPLEGLEMLLSVVLGFIYFMLQKLKINSK